MTLVVAVIQLTCRLDRFDAARRLTLRFIEQNIRVSEVRLVDDGKPAIMVRACDFDGFDLELFFFHDDSCVEKMEQGRGHTASHPAIFKLARYANCEFRPDQAYTPKHVKGPADTAVF